MLSSEKKFNLPSWSTSYDNVVRVFFFYTYTSLVVDGVGMLLIIFLILEQLKVVLEQSIGQKLRGLVMF